MYASPERNCSSKPRATGLRDEFDDSNLLVCKGHYGALGHMDARRLDELERYLTQAFPGSVRRDAEPASSAAKMGRSAY
jgi:hypothetical protein